MFNSEFYDMLSRFCLAVNHKSSLNMSGNRKSVQKGISAEFSDFREYMPGDDLRRLDWNVYARLDKMYIREYMEEKESVVSILLDTSESMNYGQKPKWELASLLGAVMAYLALNNMDRVMIYDMKNMQRPYNVSGGKNAFPKVLRWLESLEYSGSVDMFAALKQMQRKGPGITVLISDFLQEELLDEDNEQYEKMMQYLLYCRQRPVILQTLCGEELHVSMEGTLNLIDMENESKLRITMDARSIGAYENQLQALVSRMKKGVRNGGTYVLCDTTRDRNQLVLEDLRVLYDI